MRTRPVAAERPGEKTRPLPSWEGVGGRGLRQEKLRCHRQPTTTPSHKGSSG
jgi:hypothetical protein